MWTAICQEITTKTGQKFQLDTSPRPLAGGCINQGYCLSSQDKSYFVKINQASLVSMFEAESFGLEEIKATNTIKVPTPISYGQVGESSYLILEWLDLKRGTSEQNWYDLGENLARLHLVPVGNTFGWSRSNTIGSTPQPNNFKHSWADFFATERIGYQLKLAKRKGAHFADVEKIIERTHELLRDRQPVPSLVHGDLWSGNAAITTTGQPIILDPATYYGDCEVDIAMTELFGGFSCAFYRGYNNVAPLDTQYQKRKSLYNLYHVLNHFNIFGGGYQAQAQQMIKQLFSDRTHS